MKRALLVLAACHHEPATSCTAVLAKGAGATQGDVLLQPRYGDYAITIDLGPSPSPGTYNSGTTSFWSATAAHRKGACMVIGGNNAIPTGNFVLNLDSVTPPHGTLDLTLYVLPRASDDGRQADCGPRTTEQLALRF